MWSTKAAMTNTCTARESSDLPSRWRGGAGGAGRRTLLGLIALPLLLAGCVDDSASYLTDAERSHGITLKRLQEWFWQDTVRLTILVSRLPECSGGIEVKGVRRSAQPELYEAPPGYAEPIHILKIDERHYAIGMQSCRVQPFEEAPAELGTRLGVFEEKEGKFAFHPDHAGQ